MSNHIKAIANTRKREMARTKEIKLRKHLNTDALIITMRTGVAGIRDHRLDTVTHTLADSLMAGFAMFSIEDPSLLAFAKRRFKGSHNLMTIYGMSSIPCDTSMREILDRDDPNDLRPLFKDVLKQLQQGKVLEKFVFMEGCYLLNLDGISYFSSDLRHSDACLKKRNKKTGNTQHFTWITDLTINEDNVFHFMRGARARWTIETKTFNILKTQDYHFEHNFGLGKKHLSEIFVLLMMLAFLIDQIQQLCFPLFLAAWKSYKAKRSLWEKVRSKFHEFYIENMEVLY